MSPLELTSLITAISNFIACNVSDDELDLLAVALTQLGDTLATISVQKNICKNKVCHHQVK